MADLINAEVALGWGLVHLGYNLTDNFGTGLQFGAFVGSTMPDIYWIMLVHRMTGVFPGLTNSEESWGQGYIVFSGRSSLPMRETIVPYAHGSCGHVTHQAGQFAPRKAYDRQAHLPGSGAKPSTKSATGAVTS